MGILKSIHDNIFFMSLVVVLMTWSGIYVSFITDVKTKFPVEHLKSIVLAYLCGAVITLVVNLLIFPRSAEKELRTTLVKSLESLKSIVQIFENIYIFQISEDQIKKLHALTQSIRNDSNELQAQFDQTFIDISFSRRSFSEYEEIVKQTRNLQRWILLGFSTLEGLQDSNFQCSKKSMFYELGVELEEMKRMIIFGITAVQEELGYKSPSLPNQNFPRVDTNEFMQNLTMIDQNRTGELVFSVKDEENTETCCAEEHQEFQSAKIQSYSNVSFNNSSSSINFDETSTSQEKSYQFTRKSFTIVDFKSGQLQSSLIGMKKISQSFESRNLEMQNKVLLSIVTPAYSCYTSKQSNITREIKFTQLKKTQKLNNEDFDSIKFCAKNTFDASCDSTAKDKITGGETKESQRDPESEVEEDCSAKGSEIESQVFLMKCQALTLSLSEFSKSLFLLWDSTEQNKFDGQRRKTSKFCIYISSRISTIDLLKRILRSKKSTKSKDYKFCKNKDREESSQHHTNLLNKTKNNFPRILNIKYQIVSLRVFLMSPQSTCAAKSAFAILALAGIFWSGRSKKFAIDYGLRSGVIPIFVSITPTLGHSYYNIAFRLSGYIIGLAYATVILEIFHNVGGYVYNPFGLIISLCVFALPMCFLLYSNPRFMVLALLAIYSAGCLVYSQNLEINSPNGLPSIILGKKLSGLMIAFAFAMICQFLIWRTLSKHALRFTISEMIKENITYLTKLQIYAESKFSRCEVKSTEDEDQIEKDLKTREKAIQSLINLAEPLIQYSKVESFLLKDFNSERYTQIMRANQAISDQNFMARKMIQKNQNKFFSNLKGLLESSKHERIESFEKLKISLYLSASALNSKLPLPQQAERILQPNRNFDRIIKKLNDNLTILVDFSKEIDFINDAGLNSFWLYLSVIHDNSKQVKIINDSVLNFFGSWEDQTKETN